ncbi:DUF222 domain-containing protein [Diaminobutyricibacter tongyongensis]|uniref:DUF222 domain-containing protein n=1 Tax=Leifsonia tongyongensis TaxID=1268043 RepID=A0A6L9XYY3_9MICO|nr:HNH endonuclease signature motif containing protein [Diaminobutyricibacter tongyongensis]NEN06620.1 DUF222 domain-containing protein [Diaminobutyricibacter tongyongensis]
MTFPPADDLDTVAAALDALRALEADPVADTSAVVAGADAGAVADAGASGLSEAQLHARSLAAIGAVRAALERVALRRIAALDRAGSLDPATDPVRAGGHGDIGSFLAELWRTSLPHARQLCAVARATAPKHTLTGEELPPEFPELAAALLGDPGHSGDPGDPEASGDPKTGAAPTGHVSVEQAAVIIRELGKTGDGCSLEQRHRGERLLVEHAPALTVEQMRRSAIQLRDRLDEDGTEPREQIQRRRRSLTITTTRDGMTRIDWRLDAESAGHVVPQITAYVTRDFHDKRNGRNTSDGHDVDESRDTGDTFDGHYLRDSRGTGDTGDTGDIGESGHTGDARNASARLAGVRFEDPEPDTPDTPAMPETRSMAQLRSDGAVEVFRHRAGCTSGISSPPVTMIVRVSLADLRRGKGAAEIDEVPTPVSAATARRLAADANLIPMVLGRDSEVLDLGRKQRLFSPAQKHALAERDGGCAWTGCPHPPSYTQAHHIRWWDRDTGPTDLKNGILLCSHHHHRVHDDGWDIQVRDHIPWFTPPAHLDPTRTPRKGGRIRLPDKAPP